MPISLRTTKPKTRPQVGGANGETLTEAIRAAVAERYDRLRGPLGAFLAVELNAIALRCAKRPIVSPLSADEILGYDESGAPTR